MLRCTDALSIDELRGGLKYRVDGLDHIQFQVHSNGRVLPQHPIATLPNMPIIPDFTFDELRVVARIDGRFYTHYPTLWPQYFFKGTWYYPYMQRRPDDCDITTM